MTLDLRPMRLADLPAVVQLETAGHLFPWTETIFGDCLRVGYNCWLALQTTPPEPEAIVGYGVMSVALDEAHILNLCVHPQQRNQGIGTRLMQFFLHLAHEHHAQRMFLEVRVSNPGAQHIYRKLGFTQVGVRKNYYPTLEGREDALVFTKNLP